MFLAPLSANEAARLQSLHELQALDTEPEEQFDALVKLASLVFSVPIALISLVDADRVWFKANVGLPGISEMPRDTSFCTPTILSETISEVCDATLDPRFFDNLLVTAAPNICFYAGAPMRLSSGECVGTLCVIDRQPRQLDAQQRDILTELARVAASALEGRRALVAERRLLEEQARAAELLRESQALLDRTGRMAGVGGWSLDLASKAVTCSDETCRILGVEEGYRLTLEEAIGFYAPEVRQVIQVAVEKCMASGQGWDLELPLIQAGGRRIWTRTMGRIDSSDGVPVRLVGALQDVTESQAQRLAVVQAKERIEAATQSGEIGIWDLDLVTGALTWDARMYQFYGLTPIEETAAYTLWTRHLHPEDRASAEQALQDALSGLRPFDTRFRIIWGDGTVRHLRATGRATLLDDQGRALRIVGVNWDVSKVRELSLELERKEQMLRSVTDSLPMLVSYIDTEQRYRFANPTYAAWFGEPIENIVGRRVADILEASTWATAAPHLQAALQGTASVYENQLRAPGRQRDLRAQFMPQWDEHGQVEGVVSVVSDITEYKANEQRLAQAVAQATETLRQEEARWRDFSTIASDWFWETDAQHNYRFISDNFEQFYGLPASHLVGKNLKSQLESDCLNSPELMAQHVLRLDGRQPWRQFEYQVCIADGSCRWIVKSASPQFDTEGRFTGYRGNGSCITERKQVEKKTAMLADEISMINQRFALAKDAARIGVWDHNFATSKLIWSKWMYAHYAVREEDFGGTFQDWLTRLHPDDAARVDAEIAQAVRGEKDFDTDFRIVWPTGEIRHIKAAAVVQRDGRGTALKMVGVDYDITAIRLAEQAALRDQGLDLATVQRLGRIGTFVANLETEMWTSSAMLDEIFGIDANFVRSQNNWSALVAPESAQAMADYLSQVVRREGRFDKEYEIVRPSDGQRRWVHAMGEITFDAEGKPLCFKGTVQDITERKQAEKQLSAYKAFLERAERIAGVGGWELDLLTNTLLWSDQTHRIHDVEIGVQPSLDQCFRYFASQERKIIKRTAQECIAQREPWDLELPMTTATGRAIWIRSVGSVEVRDDRVVRLVGTLQDVTTVRAMREELHRSNTVLQSMLDNLPCGLSVYDNALQLVAHNHLYGGLLDLPEALFAGPVTHFEDVLRSSVARGEHGPGPVEEVVAQLLEGGRHFERLVYEHQRHDGKPLEVRSAPMPGGGFVTTYMDISERKKVERLKGEFISTVSHELRTPLTAIYGSLSMLASGMAGDLAPDVSELIGLSLSSSERLVRLINDVLDVEKIESKMMTYTMVVQPLMPLIDQAIAATWHYADQFGVQIKLETRIDSVIIKADADRIVQVMVNLLSNAAKFSERGRPVAVSMAVLADWVRVSVVDGGQGIPEAFRAQIFERFSQADNSDRRQKGGTGLGLSICKSIVQEHGGRIDYVSTPGADTEFYFELPLAP